MRLVAQRPWLTLAAAVSFALGIGVNVAVFGIADALFLATPAGVLEPSRIVRVYVRGPGLGASSIQEVATYPLYAHLRDGVRGFSRLAAFATRKMSMDRGPHAQQIAAGVVTGSFFPLLGVSTALGRFFTEAEEREGARVAVLGFEFWRRRFGGERSVLGRAVTVGKGTYTIVGIAPPGFTGVDLDPIDLWLPLGAVAPELGFPLDCGACYWLKTVARLGPGRTTSQVASEATAVLRRANHGDRPQEASVVLGPLHEARGPKAPRDATLSLWLSVATLLILFIACANVASLLLVSAIARQGEMAIRVALGAGRARVVLRVLSEAVVLAALGAVAALLVAGWVEPLLARYLLPAGASRPMLTGRVVLFSGAMVLLTGVLAGLIPALQSARQDPTRSLKVDIQQAGFRASRARAAFVAGQVALTLALLDSAGLFVSSLRHVTALPMGFDAEHLISVSADLEGVGYQKPDINLLYEQMRRQVARLPGVASAALAIGSPFAASLAIGLEAPGVPDSALQGPRGVPYYQAVSPEYFATLGTKVLRGRAFTADDRRGSPRVAIVNETMARRLWPEEDALGKCLRIDDGDFVSCAEVIAVVQDVRRNAVIELPTMQYYVPLQQVHPAFFLPVTTLLVRTVGPSARMVESIRREIQAISPSLPYVTVRSMKERLEPQLRPWRVGSALLSLAGGLALVLTAVGVYGLVGYAVTRQTRELGIRLALGASPREVLIMVCRQNLGAVAVGVGLGAAVALAAAHAVASLLYGISPTSGTVLGLAAAILLAVALLAAYLPARRATTVSPAAALRYE